MWLLLSAVCITRAAYECVHRTEPQVATMCLLRHADSPIERISIAMLRSCYTPPAVKCRASTGR